MSIESDLNAMLGGWGSRAVVLGDWIGRGILEETDVVEADRNGDPVMVRRTVLKLRRSAFLDSGGTLTVNRGDTVTVDAIAYQVNDARMEGIDGSELHLVVARVAR